MEILGVVNLVPISFIFFAFPKWVLENEIWLAKTQKSVLGLWESFLILILAFPFPKFSFRQKTEAHVRYARTTCKLRALNVFNVRTCTTASLNLFFFENGHTGKLGAHYM